MGIGIGKHAALLLILAFLAASCSVLLFPVNAAPRTIVVPDDYPSISSAIANALDGDTVLVKKGSYQEQTLQINKSLSIIGEDADKTTLNLDPPLIETWLFYQKIVVPSTAITINANDVKLDYTSP